MAYLKECKPIFISISRNAGGFTGILEKGDGYIVTTSSEGQRRDRWYKTFIDSKIVKSIICSYKAVMSKFSTKKWVTRMWFLILPMILNIFTIGLFVAVFAFISNY